MSNKLFSVIEFESGGNKAHEGQEKKKKRESIKEKSFRNINFNCC